MPLLPPQKPTQGSLLPNKPEGEVENQFMRSVDSAVQSFAYRREQDMDLSRAYTMSPGMLGTDEGRQSLQTQGELNQKDLIDDVSLKGMERGEADLTIQSQQQGTEEWDLEVAAITQLWEEESQVNPEFAAQFDNADIAQLDALKNMYAKQLKVQKAFTRVTQQISDRPWWEMAVDTAKSVVPFVDNVVISNTLSKFAEVYGVEIGQGLVGDLATPGSTLQLLNAHFMSASAVEAGRMIDSFRDYMENNALIDDPDVELQMLQALVGVTDGEKYMSNAFAFLDIADTGTIVGQIGFKTLKAAVRGVKGPVEMMRSMGAEKGAANLVDDVLEAGDAETVDDAMGALKPSIVNNTETAPLIGEVVVKSIDELLSKNGVTDLTSMKTIVKQFDEEELMLARTRTLQEIQEGLPPQISIYANGKTLKNISWSATVEESALTGSSVVKAKIGVNPVIVKSTVGGGQAGLTGFHSIDNLNRAAKRMGISDFEVVEDNAGFFIQTTHTVSPEYKNKWLDRTTDEISSTGKFFNFLKSMDNTWSKRAAGITHLAGDASETIGIWMTGMLKPIAALNKKELEKFESVLQIGRGDSVGREPKWFSDDELVDEFGFSPKEIDAYHAYQQVEDAAYSLDNTLAWSTKNDAGYKTVVVDSTFAKANGIDEFDAIPVDDVPNLNGQTLLDLSTGKEIRLDGSDLQQLKDKGMRLFRIDDDNGFFTNKPYQYVLAFDQTTKVKSISYQQLAYLPGGRIRYEGDHFIGQARVVKVDGKLVNKPSRVLGVALDETEARSFARGMEEARKTFNDWKNKRIDSGEATLRIQKALVDHNDIAGLDDFRRLVDDDIVDPSIPFEYKLDGGRFPTEQANLNSPNAVGDPEAKGLENDLMRLQYGNGNRFKERGARLTDLMGNPAPILDPISAMDATVHRMGRTASSHAYKKRMTEEWIDEFSSVLEKPAGRSGADNFADPQYIATPTASQKKLINQAQQVKGNLDTFLGAQTKGEKVVQDGMSTLASKFTNRKTAKNIKDARPLDIVTRLAFDAHIGMFSISSALLQFSQLVPILAVAGKTGMKAMAGTPLFKMALRTNDLNAIEGFAKAAEKLGWTKKEFRETLADLRDMSKYSIKHSFSEAELASKTVKSGVISKGYALTTSFFEAAEGMVRLTAFVAARGEYLRRTGKTSILTQLDRAEVSLLTDVYSGSMVKASKAQWQRGVMKIPTQFMSYTARITEALLPQALGGSTVLSKTQKMNLALYLLMAYGLDGTLGDDAGTNIVGGWEPDSYGERVLKNVVKDGSIEVLWFGATGMDSDWGARMGPKLGENVISDLLTADKEAWEVLFGVGGARLAKIGGGSIQVVGDFVNALRVPEYKTTDAFLDAMENSGTLFADSIKSMSDANKALIAWNLGEYINKKGDTVSRDLTRLDAVLLSVGIRPQSLADYWQDTRQLRNRNDDLKDTQKKYVRLMKDWSGGELTKDEFYQKRDALLLMWTGDYKALGRIYQAVPEFAQDLSQAAKDKWIKQVLDGVRTTEILEERN